MLCGSAPHCRAGRVRGGRFCERCQRRMDVIKARAFPETVTAATPPAPDCAGMNDSELAHAIIRYVREVGRPVPKEVLAGSLNVSMARLYRATDIAKSRGWLGVRGGRGGGFIPGTVAPPE